MNTGKKQKYLENRELSWLKFNGRVLEEAADKSVPLCERISFLSIFQSNLDEFFMVRVGSLYDQMLADKNARDNKTGMTSKEQLDEIFAASRTLSEQKDNVYRECMKQLEKEGIECVRFSDILPEDKAYLENYFTESLLPLLSPQVIGKKQPLAQLMEETKQLLVAPKCLQNKVLTLIDGEIEKAKAGKEGYIGLKMNALTDKVIIEKLVAASKAGVKIDMVIRGICCLLPRVKEDTENIRVISIVGRYLEHSRIYIFGRPETAECRVYIASADFMTRNTTKRVEIAVPLLDKEVKERVCGIFNLTLRDNVKARELQSDGTYLRVQNSGVELNSQECFFRLNN